jgi:large subunit ribosomal protein LX
MEFVLSGSFRIGEKNQKFSKTVEAGDEEGAKEKVYSLFGSEHGTKRRWIKIDSVKKSTGND